MDKTIFQQIITLEMAKGSPEEIDKIIAQTIIKEVKSNDE